MSNLNYMDKHKQFLYSFVDSDVDQIASKVLKVDVERRVSMTSHIIDGFGSKIITDCNCSSCTQFQLQLANAMKRIGMQGISVRLGHGSLVAYLAVDATQALQKGVDGMTYMQNLYAQTVENIRAHKASEAQKDRELTETERSHRVNEALSEADLQEKIRHQITQDTETMRHNLVSEAEIALHNRNTEAISREANSVSRLAAELNYKAQHERTITERDIADMQNQTKLYLESAQLRINEANSKAQKEQATAKLMEAKAKIDAAEAAMMNAVTNADLAPSQKYANIGRGTRDLTAAVETVSDTVQDWIPQSKAANAAGDVADSVAKASSNAKKAGRKAAKSTGKTARDIINNSGYGNE